MTDRAQGTALHYSFSFLRKYFFFFELRRQFLHLLTKWLFLAWIEEQKESIESFFFFFSCLNILTFLRTIGRNSLLFSRSSCLSVSPRFSDLHTKAIRRSLQSRTTDFTLPAIECATLQMDYIIFRIDTNQYLIRQKLNTLLLIICYHLRN